MNYKVLKDVKVFFASTNSSVVLFYYAINNIFGNGKAAEIICDLMVF